MKRTPVRAGGPMTYVPTTDDYPDFGPTGTWTRTSTTATTTATPTPTTPPLPTGYAALGGNALWQNPEWGLQNQPCNPQGWPSDTATAAAFYESALLCLDTGWKPLVDAAGQEFRGAKVLVPTGTVVQSPCGTNSVGPTHNPAFYCGSTETIYMPLEGLPAARYGSQAVIYLSMLAHEYGHHVQALVGALAEEYRQANAAGFDSAGGLELSRRLELQAQCFSGMLIGSIANVRGRTGGRFGQQDIDIAFQDALRGDWEPTRYARDHGTPQHGQGWWEVGDTSNRVSQCNTWNAPSGDVS
ncbi:neutral zinc metallopeptidase [Mycolicibacterium llatzerense]|uniref:neutral zinc metallopeptidase n=2 Tax=Mycolicibacterium llatzerense TaxID=280871 RepID=UPI0021B5925C|nr:neutral zinc metallopeptidase [Mycolicibacterium llatzerense]